MSCRPPGRTGALVLKLMALSSHVETLQPVPAATRPHYGRVLWTFLRNSLIREMAFRGNFIIEIITSAFWFCTQLLLFTLIFGNVRVVNGWTRPEYFAFTATGM